MEKHLLRLACAVCLAGVSMAVPLETHALAQKNVYAYDIAVTHTDAYHPVVTYKLNGAAKNVKVRAYIGTKMVKEVAGTATADNSVTLDLSEVAVSGNVTFAVYAETKTAVTAPTLIKDGAASTGSVLFSSPRGVTINNCTDSPTFGTMIVSDGGESKAGTISNAATTGRGSMLYAFDPGFVHLINNQAQGHGGFSGNLVAKIQDEQTTFARVKYSDDGRLFLHTGSFDKMGLYEIGSSNGDITSYNGSTQILQGDLKSSGIIRIPVTEGTGTHIGGAGFGIDTYGTGENLKIVLGNHHDLTATGVKTKVMIYNLGTKKSWSTKASKTWGTTYFDGTSTTGTTYAKMIRPYGGNVCFDADGKGVWYTTYTSGDTKTDCGAQHFNADYNATEENIIDYNSADNGQLFQYAGAVSYNRDRTILAVSGQDCIRFFRVSKDAGGKPVLTQITDATITSANYFNQQSTGIAFDYADNVYITNRTKGVLVGYQMPKSICGTTNRETPAPSNTSYEITAKVEIALTAAKAAWSTSEGGKQTVALSWDAVDGATSYDVCLNDEKVATVSGTTYTAAMPIFNNDEADANVKAVFQVTCTVNGTEKKSNHETVYHKNFDCVIAAPRVVATQPENGGNTAVLTWETPKQAGVVDYPVYKYYVYDAKNATDAGTQIAELFGRGLTNPSLTVNDATFGDHYYYIVAEMSQKLNTGASKYSTTVSGSANRTQTYFAQRKVAAHITELKSYPGRNKVRVKWEMFSGANIADINYYRVYRDGICIADNLDARGTNDMMVPDGQHTYTVEVVYKDGVCIESDPVALSEPIDRDQAITQYGIEEIYNYPIVTKEMATKMGLNSSNAFIAENYPAVANMMKKDGSSGQMGGLYRSAVYHNGYWYLSQLNDHNVDMAGYPGAIDYGDKTGHGGIIRFNANNILSPTANEDGNPKRIIELAPSTNQMLARGPEDTNHTFVYRAPDNNSMFYGAMPRFAISSTKSTQYIETPALSALHYGSASGVFEGQTGRVHYCAASGALRNEGSSGYVYMALNKLNTMFRIPVAQRASAGTPQEFHIPDNMIEVLDAPHHTVFSTENYAFPVAGRKNAMLWTLRSQGTFLVETDDNGTAANTKYTKVLTGAESTNAGGMTFVYNGELFFIHSVSIHSNNSGHFVIDIPLRRDRSKGPETADFTELVPCVGVTQSESTTNDAANANAIWFGVEPSADENCVYIYQYVPGKRFAKYRFYSYEDYPAVEPEINVNVQHNDENTDITHFDIDMKWERPEKYQHAQYNDFKISHYNFELLDSKLKPLMSEKVVDPGYDATGVKFEKNYVMNVSGDKHVNWQTYSVRVTPVYQSTKDATRLIDGETGVASHKADYEGSIGSSKAKAFYDATGAETVYRVDLDFDRADLAQFPEPVTHFTIEYKRPGDSNWQKVPKLRLHMNGETLSSTEEDVPNMNKHTGKVHGQYRFGNESTVSTTATAVTDKNYSLHYVKYRQPEADAFPCVGWHMTTENPTGNVYRMTAHYAAGNSFITKTYSTETDPIASLSVSTGVADIMAENGGAVKAWPTPTEGSLTVMSPEAIRVIEIYSASGAKVMTIDGSDLTTQHIDVAPLPAGMYLLRVNGATPVRVVRK